PFFTLVTPAPTSRTMPAPSCPRIAGNSPSGSAPDRVNSSVWQMPVAMISTSTSPPRGPSRSTVATASGSPALCATAARTFIGSASLPGRTLIVAHRRETDRMSGDIRPFSLHVAEADIADLAKRLASVRWPDEAPDAPWRYGTSLAFMREMVEYWARDYDWRKTEAQLNVLPQFMTP